jgi:cytoskeletal protein CcmA (bactofilin family)
MIIRFHSAISGLCGFAVKRIPSRCVGPDVCHCQGTGRLLIFPSMANPTNVLSSGIEITGSIRFSNDMIIDGKIEGEINSDKGRVTIGENAIIKGDVTAGDVKVYGKVEGKITSQRCELKDKSRINGDIKSKVFSMEEGAQLSGRTEIGG